MSGDFLASAQEGWVSTGERKDGEKLGAIGTTIVEGGLCLFGASLRRAMDQHSCFGTKQAHIDTISKSSEIIRMC